MVRIEDVTNNEANASSSANTGVHRRKVNAVLDNLSESSASAAPVAEDNEVRIQDDEEVPAREVN